MFPHPDTVFKVRTMQNRGLLAEPTQARLFREAVNAIPTPSLIDRCRTHVHQILAWIAVAESTSRGTRQLAKA